MKFITEEDFIKKYGACRDNTKSYEFFITDLRYCTAGCKFNELLSIYNTGRSFLIDAVNSDEWYHKLGLTDETSILWHRHTYFLMSALLFNQCLDYFLQILWAFLDKDKLDDKEAFECHFKKCKCRTVNDAIKKLKDVAKKDSKKFLDFSIINDTKKVYRDCSNLREDLVNEFKHRGYIFCDELEPYKIIDVLWKNKYGTELRLCDLNKQYSLTEEEEIILRSFKAITDLIDKYEKFLNEENFFSIKDGAINILSPKNFPDWRRDKKQ